VPLLIEAMGSTDSGPHVLARRLWGNVPRFLRDRLPEPIAACDIRRAAWSTLTAAMTNSSAARPINRAVAAGFARVPEACRIDVIRGLGADASAADVVEPLLIAAVRSPDRYEQVAAAESLLAIHAGSSKSMTALVAGLAPLAKRPQELPNAWPNFCREFGRLGPAASVALPLLRELATNSLPEVRAEAALACWRIDPAGESAGAFFAGELSRLGDRGTMVLVTAWTDEASALKIPADEALPLLARLIERGARAGRLPGVRPPTESVLFLTTERYTPRRLHYPPGLPDPLTRALACDLVAGYGAEAQSLEPQLHQAAGHPEPIVREAARRALTKLAAAAARNR
jgi:hypothetical protein